MRDKRHWWKSGFSHMGSENKHVIEAMGPGEVIGRAVRLLRARHEVSESAAFEMMVRGPSDSHEAVREIAAAIVLQSDEA